MEELLFKISQLNLLVIGDIMLDHYIWGDANRISPEAPVPVVMVEHDSYVAGGAANVALNSTQLGASSELVGWIGNDPSGRELLSIFKKTGVKFNPHFLHSTLPTILKTRVIVRHQQLCRLDRELSPNHYSLEPSCIKIIEACVNKANALIFSDYFKGNLTEKFAQDVLSIAREKNCFIALDPKPKRKLVLPNIDLLTPNKREALELADLSHVHHEVYPTETICQRIWEKYHPKYLVITLGSDGMLLSEEGHIKQIIPTAAREVYDVSGAGDTVITALTLALTAGAKIEEAAHFANVAAGIVVAKVGTATASPREILEYLRHEES